MENSYLDTYEYGLIATDMVDITILPTLCEKILGKEEYIKNLNDQSRVPFKYVNKDSITQYHYYYSLMELGIEEVDVIVIKIKEMVFKLFGWETFYLKMWGNIYRKGDYIGLHKHMDNKSHTKFPYAISGHCFVHSTQPTATTFFFRNHKKSPHDSTFKEVDVPNVPGEITLFSSYIEHEFKQWDGDLRISLAFDINNQPDADIELLEKWKFIKV